MDIKTAVRRLLWGKLMNAGQTCIAPDYVLCKRSMNDSLVSTMVETIKEYYGQVSSQIFNSVRKAQISQLTVVFFCTVTKWLFYKYICIVHITSGHFVNPP